MFPFIFFENVHLKFLLDVNFLLDPGGRLQQLSLDTQKRWKDPFKIS